MAKWEVNIENMGWSKKYGTQDKGGGDIEYIKEELKKAWRELYSIQGKADQMTKTYLKDLVT